MPSAVPLPGCPCSRRHRPRPQAACSEATRSLFSLGMTSFLQFGQKFARYFWALQAPERRRPVQRLRRMLPVGRRAVSLCRRQGRARPGPTVTGPAPRETGTQCKAQAGPPARSWRSGGVPLPSPSVCCKPLLLTSSPETTQHNPTPCRMPHLMAGPSRDGAWSPCRQKASWQLAKHRWPAVA